LRISTKIIHVALGATLFLALPLTCTVSAMATPADTASRHVTRQPRSIASSSDNCTQTGTEALCANAPSADGGIRPSIVSRPHAPHLKDAEELIDHLNKIGWPKERKYNRYRTGSEKTEVKWGTRGQPTTYKNLSQCASFVTETLKHTYPRWADRGDFFKANFGHHSPFANDYYDKIADSENPAPHFRAIRKVTDLQPGDIIVIKYPESEDLTGHVMLVRDVKGRHEGGPRLDGATQYKVETIDTTRNPHGRHSDTRITGETGVGYGQMTFYADENGMFAGYRWSLSSGRINPADTHPIIAARITR
jgi:hypothetical protein